MACAVYTAANAAPVTYTSRAAFDAATGGGLHFESFESTFFGSPVFFANGFSLSETTSPAGSELWVDSGDPAGVTDGAKAALYSRLTGSTTSIISTGNLHFAPAVNAVGFDLTVDFSGGLSVNIVADGVPTTLTLAHKVTQFFGVIDTTAPISLVSLESAGSGGNIMIDAVSFGPLITATEPATLAIFGLGLAAIGLTRRRRTVRD